MLNIKQLCRDEFLPTYTLDCIGRSSNRNYNLPETLSLLLYSIYINSGAKNTKIKVDEIVSTFSKHKKYNEKSSYNALANMTKQPFPLVHSGKAADSSSMNTVVQPLIDEQTGSLVGQRYARISLTQLGQKATKWFDSTTNPLLPPLSFVPISLLRHSLPISLGIKEEMWGLNPQEIFKLMIVMLDNKTPNIPTSEINNIFKGVDVGEHYHSYCSDANLKFLWSIGRSSCVVVPDIQVDRFNKIITIKRPQCGSTSSKLKVNIINHMKDALIKGTRSFQTFTPSTQVQVNGGETYFLEVQNFIGTDEEIKRELWALPYIQKYIQLANMQTFVDEQNNITIDIEPVKDTLYKHLELEYTQQRRYIQDLINTYQQDLKVINLIEKVTRDGVKEYIQSILLKKNRRELLAQEFAENSTSKLKTTHMQDTYISMEEANLVFAERNLPQVNGSRINILAVLSKRDKYLNEYSHILAEVNNLKDKLNNPDLILADMRNELLQLANSPELVRKTKANFIDDGELIIQEAQEILTPTLNPSLQKYNIPITLLYSNDIVFKYIGRNINIERQNFKYLANKRLNILNVTSYDSVYIVLQNKTITVQVRELNNIITDYTNIKAIIPVEHRQYLLHLYDKPSKLSVIKTVNNLQDFVLSEDYDLIHWQLYDTKAIGYDILTLKNGDIYFGRFEVNQLNQLFLSDNRVNPNIGVVQIITPIHSLTQELSVTYNRSIKRLSYNSLLNENNKFVKIPPMSDLDFFGVLPKEIYYGNFYIPNPEDYDINYSKGSSSPKKPLFQESSILLTKDAQTIELESRVKTAYSNKALGNNLCVIPCNSSTSYKTYDITQVFDNLSEHIDDRLKVKTKHYRELPESIKPYITEYYNLATNNQDLKPLDTPFEKYMKILGGN